MARAVTEKVRLENEFESKKLVSNQARAQAFSELHMHFKKTDRQMWQQIPCLHSFLDSVPLFPRLKLEVDEEDILCSKSGRFGVSEYYVSFDKLQALVTQQGPIPHQFENSE